MFVTGAGGFIGRHLVARLVARGATVTAASWRFPRTATARRSLAAAEPVELDVRSKAQVRRALYAARPEIIFHLAAIGVTDPSLAIRAALRVNVEGTVNVLEGAPPDARVILARTPNERSGLNVYGASKAAAWAFGRMFAASQGIRVCGAMIFHCYGPGQSERNVLPAALQAARSGADFPMSPGEQVRDWIYVEDVVDGLLETAVADLDPGDTVELGTGVGTPLGEVVRRVYECTPGSGRPLPGRLPYRPGEAMQVVADADATYTRLGWRARVALADGIERFVRTHGK